MRVIAGEWKGRKLLSPLGREIRPTSDKVKGAIFSMLGERIVGAQVLDLFSGTGNLGIEALSRGAAHCVFCDHARESIALLKDNLQKLGIEDRATVIHGDFRRALKYDRIDIILADPPYGRGLGPQVLSTLADCGLPAPGGVVVLERSAGDTRWEETDGLYYEKTKRYGKTLIDVYGRM